MRRFLFSLLICSLILAGIISVPVQAHAQSEQLYVSNSGDNTISVLDPTTGNAITTIPVGTTPRGIVFNGKYVYIADISSQDIFVVDPTTNSVVKTISVGTGGPERLALSPDKKTLYVSDEASTVYVIDTTTNTVTQTVPGFSNPDGMAVSLDGTRLYVTNSHCCGSTSWVSVLDTTTYSTITTIPVGVQPTDIAITPDGTKAYVTNYNGSMPGPGNSVSVIDLSTNSVIQTISDLPTNPNSVVFNHAGTKAYVADNNYWFGGGTQTATSYITVIDTATNSVITEIPVGYVPDNVAISPDDSTAYSTNEFSNTVSVIDTATNTVTNTFISGTHPWGIALIPTVINLPATKDDCKNGGWKNLADNNGNPFNNQGECISFFEKTH